MYEVLIVDDEPMIRQGLKMMVRWEEYGFLTVRTAANGEEALFEIQKQAPDLMITDIRMPRVDGIELLKRIRKEGMEIRVIVLSGYDDFEYVRSMAVLGIENYLLKPVDEDEINLNVSNVSHKIRKEKEMKLQSQMDQNLIRENIINRWIYGSIGEKELLDRAEFLGLDLDAGKYQPFLLKELGKEAAEEGRAKNEIYRICCKSLDTRQQCYHCQNHAGDTVVIWCFAGGVSTEQIINECVEAVEEAMQIRLYALVGNEVQSCWKVGNSFREAVKNGVYRKDEGEIKPLSGSDLEKNLAPFTIRMAQYALEHYQEEVSLKTLANHFKGNAAYMGQNFKKDTGKSFSDYLKEIRIKKAKELLTKRDYKAKEVGVRVGFQNDAYFSSTFKKETGLTPAEYRKEFLK